MAFERIRDQRKTTLEIKMNVPTTQRSGWFWKYNICDRFTGQVIKTDNGFATQKEAAFARKAALAPILARAKEQAEARKANPHKADVARYGMQDLVKNRKYQ